MLRVILSLETIYDLLNRGIYSNRCLKLMWNFLHDTITRNFHCNAKHTKACSTQRIDRHFFVYFKSRIESVYKLTVEL